MLEPPGAHDNRDRQRPRRERRPARGPGTLERAARGRGQRLCPGHIGRSEHALVGVAQAQRRGGQQEESGPQDAEPIAKHAKQQRREEATETTERAHQSGDCTGVPGKSLGNQLEDGAVAQPEQHRAGQGSHREGNDRRPHQQQRTRRDAAEHPRQDLRPPDPIRQPAADRPHQGCEDDEPGRPESGVGRHEMKLRPQQRRQVDREGDESAEGQEVEGPEQPRRRLPLQQRDHRADAGGTRRLRRIAGHERVQPCPETVTLPRRLERRWASRKYPRPPARRTPRATGRAYRARRGRARCPAGRAGSNVRRTRLQPKMTPRPGQGRTQRPGGRDS